SRPRKSSNAKGERHLGVPHGEASRRGLHHRLDRRRARGTHPRSDAMKEFFDTSVLVAACLGDHPHHEASAKAFVKAAKKRSSCAAHSLAELYSTLTSLPLKPMISPV